ncbi:hypothetical protein, partial [Faecalibacillus intestinalis]|uniref:hypothetical protein n=1 Tax=Faecalibacillus intestinalis TaxID=1982626 RepID=UPI001EDDA6FD
EEARQIEVSPETVAEEINYLLEDGKMQQEETKIFENSLYFAEQGISEYLKKLIGRSTQTFSDEKILKNIEQVE